QILQAVMYDLRHRPIDDAARRYAALQEIRDVLQAPVAEAGLAIGGQRRGVPVLHGNEAALEGVRLRRAAERIDRRMAHAAMAEALDQVGAAIPLGRFGRVRLELAFAEEQRAPA